LRRRRHCRHERRRDYGGACQQRRPSMTACLCAEQQCPFREWRVPIASRVLYRLRALTGWTNTRECRRCAVALPPVPPTHDLTPLVERGCRTTLLPCGVALPLQPRRSQRHLMNTGPRSNFVWSVPPNAASDSSSVWRKHHCVFTRAFMPLKDSNRPRGIGVRNCLQRRILGSSGGGNVSHWTPEPECTNGQYHRC
jgi:hypothetical protein